MGWVDEPSEQSRPCSGAWTRCPGLGPRPPGPRGPSRGPVPRPRARPPALAAPGPQARAPGPGPRIGAFGPGLGPGIGRGPSLGPAGSRASVHIRPDPQKKDAVTATAMFNELMDHPDAITDDKGPEPKFRDRVAVKVKDRIIDRDATIDSQIVEGTRKEIKNPDAQTVQGLMQSVSRGSLSSGMLFSGDGQHVAGKMLASRQAAMVAGESSGFSAAGSASSFLPDVTDLGTRFRQGHADIERDCVP